MSQANQTVNYRGTFPSAHPPSYQGTYMEPKLNARLIRSVMKYFEHLPYRLSNTWRLKKFFKNVGWSNDRKVGNALFRTKEYDNEACNAPSLICQHFSMTRIGNTEDERRTLRKHPIDPPHLVLPISQPLPSIVLDHYSM
jgi:hypothetical protein